MSDIEPPAAAATPAGDEPRPAVESCQFPTGPDPDQVCGRPVARTPGVGRPGRYCDLPDHTRARAFAARRAYERAAVSGPGGTGGEAGVGELGVDEEALAARPVSDGRVTLGVILARFADEAAAQRRDADERTARMAALLDRA